MNNMAWHIILSREQSTMADTWTEYLCAKVEKGEFVLGVCIHEILQYIPEEWFDDDGEPLPEFRDANGDLELPAEYNGRSVEGHDGECLLGPLDQWNNEDTAYLTELTPEAVSQALDLIEWAGADVEDVLSALAGLKEEPK
jgi:hypothetical protein